MKCKRTERFKRMYKKLDAIQKKKIKTALSKMSEDIPYPSLRIKRIQSTQGIWEASATSALRITFEWEKDTIILRNCGDHDKTLKNP